MTDPSEIHIHDEAHYEWDGPYPSFEDALAELRRRASIPWDNLPNRAPCQQWRTCGREYHVRQYDTRQNPWQLLRDIHVLDVSARGVAWVEEYERAWLEPRS